MEKLVKLAKQQNRNAQKQLYEMLAPKMLALAQSYINNIFDAEDLLMQCFLKAFSQIKDCRDDHAFGGWLRRMVINDSISFIRKKKNIQFVDIELADDFYETDEFEFEEINLSKLFLEMPDGYRIVFNLYVFEEKSHAEIAKSLEISEGTSKSQYSKAKKWISTYLKNTQNEENHVRKIKI